MNVSSLFDLGGRVSIVTGGGYGLGKIMATALGEAGSDIVICSRKSEKCEETAHDIERLGIRALALQCDVNRDEDVDRVVGETVREFQRIDSLVNNSRLGWGAPPEEFKMEDWEKVITLNTTGTFRFTQKAGREMIKRKSGKIITVSSYAGLQGTDPDISIRFPTIPLRGP